MRRALRSHPDDCSSAANSVNPSPKKQPRLNLQCAKDNHWSSYGHQATTTSVHENMYKRYKLEDQLSDIQYIDCSTPEHTVNNPNIISAQIHNPPTSKCTFDLNDDAHICNDTVIRSIGYSSDGKIKNRCSYPAMKLNDTATDMSNDVRFSYPSDGNKFMCRVPIKNTATKIGRFSYCDPFGNGLDNIPTSLVLRSNSAEIIKRSDLDNSKLSIATPSSPAKSPGYSLLVGDTSSENSSLVNTPIYDHELPASRSTLQLDIEQLAKNHMNYAPDNNEFCNVSLLSYCLIILIIYKFSQ